MLSGFPELTSLPVIAPEVKQPGQLKRRIVAGMTAESILAVRVGFGLPPPIGNREVVDSALLQMLQNRSHALHHYT
jgi:hypothetical protein